jgi:hypothetical protein
MPQLWQTGSLGTRLPSKAEAIIDKDESSFEQK